jgi:hypothetical protein
MDEDKKFIVIQIKYFIFFIILMDLILKQLIIITGTFLIILWFQNVDDRKHNKTRNTFYEKYKFPILVTAIIGLVINIPEIMSSINKQCDSNQSDIAIFTLGEPIKKITKNIERISPVDLTRKSIRNIISEQQIYTDLPDF